MSRYDDDDGQVDGDYVGAATMPTFARYRGEVPWGRANDAPWKMWGTTETFRAPLTTQPLSVGPIPAPRDTHQLGRVAYKRPESFRFLFHARIVEAPASPGPVVDGEFVNLTVVWEIITGVGRTQSIQDEFARVNWLYADGPAPTGRVKWLTQTNSPPLLEDTSGLVLTSTTPVQVIVGEDIQCRAFVHAFTPETWFTPGAVAVVEVTALFAPNVHQRPDWFHPDGPIEQVFPGDEIGGR